MKKNRVHKWRLGSVWSDWRWVSAKNYFGYEIKNSSDSVGAGKRERLCWWKRQRETVWTWKIKVEKGERKKEKWTGRKKRLMLEREKWQKQLELAKSQKTDSLNNMFCAEKSGWFLLLMSFRLTNIFNIVKVANSLKWPKEYWPLLLQYNYTKSATSLFIFVDDSSK